jgi:hypothetical protein
MLTNRELRKPSGREARGSANSPQPSQGRGACALHIKFLVTRLNRGEQMLPEMSAWLQRRKIRLGLPSEQYRLLVFHRPAAPPIPNTVPLTFQQMLPATTTRILHPWGPMETQDFPLIRTSDTKIALLTFANTKEWIESRNWQMVTQKSLAFLFEIILCSH